MEFVNHPLDRIFDSDSMYPLGKTCGYSFAEGKLLEVNGIVLLVIKNDHEFEHKLYSWGVRRVRAGMQLGSRNCPGLQGTPAHPSASFYKELRKNSAAPDPKPVEVPFYGADAMTRVIDVSNEPYRTLFWLTGQTGIRRSEVCALRYAMLCSNETVMLSSRESLW